MSFQQYIPLYTFTIITLLNTPNNLWFSYWGIPLESRNCSWVPAKRHFRTTILVPYHPVQVTVCRLKSYLLVYLIEAEWRIYASVNLTIIGSDNGLSPGRRQAITWTSAGILLIGPLGTNFSEILMEIHTFSLKKMHLKMSSGKWQPFCLGLNVILI